MNTERYLPKKYRRDSRSRRKRSRVKRVILIVAVVIALLVLAYFVYRWATGGQGGGSLFPPVVTVTPSATTVASVSPAST